MKALSEFDNSRFASSRSGFGRRWELMESTY